MDLSIIAPNKGALMPPAGQATPFHAVKRLFMTICKHSLRQHLEKVFANQELAKWFDPLAMTVDEEQRLIRFSFPHAFFRQWFMQTIQPSFEKQAVSHLTGMTFVYEGGNDIDDTSRRMSSLSEGDFDQDGSVPSDIVTAISHQPFEPAQDQAVRTSFSSNSTRPRASAKRAVTVNSHSPLTSHTFDTFIMNRKNDFPVAAAQEAVNKALSPAYTPFVIYGQSGSGKTHLLGAMANALHNNAPDLPFFYGGVEYLDHISLSHFRSSLIQEQVVFLDDIQRAYVNPELQDALVALIDFFHASSRLLALCADSHPAGSPGVSQKLLSRLTGGLLVEVKKPDMDIRRQYLQQKNSDNTLGLSKEHILSLAQHYQDIRSIDGLLARISAYRSLLHRQEADMDKFFERTLEESHSQRFLTSDKILEIVGRHFSVSPQDIAGKKRDKSVALARPVAMLLCRELLGLSLERVGQIFGGRDHSSVLYSLNKIKGLQESNKDTNTKVSTLKHLCLTQRET